MTSQINPTGRIDVAAAAVDYLATRRALGYKLRQQGQLLTDFVAHLNMVGAEHLTTAVAVDWALRPAGADPVWWSAKLDAIRGFARYLQVLDPVD
jgi:integrase/recombinase XerD